VNSLNGLLRNAWGQSRLFIDASCRQLLKDFECVRWKRDANGNTTDLLDKTDPWRTHLSDAVACLVEREFPLTPRWGEVAEYLT